MKVTRVELAALAAVNHEDVERPRSRSECVDGSRPCPFVGCRHHLYLDVNPQSGSLIVNRPDLEPWQLVESCSLDVADRGEHTLESVGQLLNLTRERIRQIELRALHNPAIAEMRAENAA